MASKFNCMALILCMALGATMLATANFTCCEVKPLMGACNSYVTSGGNSVPQNCCHEVSTLKEKVTVSKLHRQQACRCIIHAAMKIPDINASAFSSLPENCGVRLPYNIRLDTDCDTIY